MKYSIIGSGFVSSILQTQIDDFVIYDRNNLNELKNRSHNVIILCAPTGNRLRVSADPDKDFDDCRLIVENIEQSQFDKIVHISTVDVFQKNRYGQNRKWIEEQFINDLRYNIIRLPSLIHPTIKKNILYDLSHRQWLEKISLDSVIQWYPLDNLFSDIKKSINYDIRQNNLVSRPISNKELIENLEPGLAPIIKMNHVDPMYYDNKSHDGDYWVPDRDVWSSIKSCYSIMKSMAP